jgi:hypothetical protein
VSSGEKLHLGVSSDAVRALHRALVDRGFDVPREELAEGVFTSGTHDALGMHAARGLAEIGVYAASGGSSLERWSS